MRRAKRTGETVFRVPALWGAVAAVALCLGCGAEKEFETDRPIMIPRKAAGSSLSGTELYRRHYYLWWAAHSNVETAVSRRARPTVLQERFRAAVDGLRGMLKSLPGEKRTEGESLVTEYERLRDTAETRGAERRVLAGLSRIKKRVKKEMSPDAALQGSESE